MESETVDRIEHMARGLAVVLVALVGLQTLSGEIEGQLGPFATFAALMCIGVSWHARLVRGCLIHQPKLFVIVVATCLAVMTAAFLAATSGPAPTTSFPIA
jgi:hypothetical protein